MLWAFFIYGLVVLAAGLYAYTRFRSPSALISSGDFPSVSAQISVYGILFVSVVPTAASGGNSVKGILIASGACLGMILSYLFICRRIRVYSELSGHSKTLPEFLENRFDDKNGILRAFSASVILVFGILLSASVLDAACGLVSAIFGIEKITLLVTVCAFSVIYLFMGCLAGVTSADLTRGLVFLAFLVFLIVAAFRLFDPSGIVDVPDEILLFKSNFNVTETVFSDILSALGCILLFFGLPQVLTRFIGLRERRHKKRRLVLCAVWLVPAAAGSFLVGFCAPPNAPVAEIFGSLAENSSDIPAAVMIAAVFSALMSAADSSCAISAAVLSHDLFGSDRSKNVLFTRLCFAGAMVAVFIYTVIGDLLPSDIILPVEFLLSAFASAFAPTVLFCLYSEKITSLGSVCSMIAGILSSSVLFYRGGPIGISGIAILPLSFLFSSAVIFIVSLLDKRKPTARMRNEFGRTREIVRMK